MKAKNLWKFLLGAACAVAGFAADIGVVLAHGERAQEPFLRMRTIQWYDVKWQGEGKVNDEFVVSGNFHISEDWPHAVTKPERAFMNMGTPSPVFFRTSSTLNGVPMFISGPLQIGGDYRFEVKMRGRIPGDHHVHPMVSVEHAGPVAGPGQYMKISGNQADFLYTVKTLDGQEINVETFNTANSYLWHGVWILLGAVWLIYFLRNPIFLVRARALFAGREDVLLPSSDRNFAIVMLVVTLGIAIGSAMMTDAKYQKVVPLQSGSTIVEPLPVKPNPLRFELINSGYDVPGRSMKVNMKVTNSGDVDEVITEFTTAGLRFLNEEGIKLGTLDPAYPADIVAKNGFRVNGNNWTLKPGETREMSFEMTDVLWETQRLISLLNDPESRFGGLIISYDANKERHLSSIAGPIIPQFVN